MSSVTLLQSRTEAAVPNPTASAAALGPNPAPSFTIGLLHYDPAAAARPDLKLTPGDPLPDSTVEDVCAPGWVTDHRLRVFERNLLRARLGMKFAFKSIVFACSRELACEAAARSEFDR